VIRVTLTLAASPGKKPVTRVGAPAGHLTMDQLKRLWEAEQAINELSGIRIHINVEEGILDNV
jgi:hypothetical protein